MGEVILEERQFSAGGIVVKGEKENLQILLIKDRFGHWTWPKGHIEKGETPGQAALREIREETGLRTLEIIKEIGRQEYWFTQDEKKIFKKVRIFLVKALENEELKIQTSEIQDARWYPPKDVLKTIEYEGSKDLLEKGINFLN